MKQLRSLSLASLGLALAAVVAPSAQAQGNSRVIVCRDGSRFESTNASVCSRHNGVDGRATQIARRNDRWDDRRDRRNDDDRDRRDRDNDGRYGNNDGRNGNNDGRYGVLTGKAFSLEPATGFAFDTLMVARGQ